jgi:hypothetical protein
MFFDIFDCLDLLVPLFANWPLLATNLTLVMR